METNEIIMRQKVSKASIDEILLLGDNEHRVNEDEAASLYMLPE